MVSPFEIGTDIQGNTSLRAYLETVDAGSKSYRYMSRRWLLASQSLFFPEEAFCIEKTIIEYNSQHFLE